MKKIIKRIVLPFFILFLVLLTLPYIFKDKIKAQLLDVIHQNIYAHVEFDHVELSFIKNFPKARIRVKGLTIINKAPFEGDTLFSSTSVYFNTGILSILRSKNHPIHIDAVVLDNIKLSIVEHQGVSNMDIAAKQATPKDTQKDSIPSNIGFKLHYYGLHNASLSYHNKDTDLKVELSNLNHDGSGNFSSQIMHLDTQTHADLFFEHQGITYLEHSRVALDAIFEIDLAHQKYSFQKNEFKINDLPLEFEGFVQLFDNYQDVDLQFKTTQTSFENALKLVPPAYSKELKDVTTSGNFSLVGAIQGKVAETVIPSFDIHISSSNGTLQYPDLPKRIEKITLDAQVNNSTGNLEDTLIEVHQFSCLIDKDLFNITAKVKNINDNPIISSKLNGIINLESISVAYPMQLSDPIQGILNANISTTFDLHSATEKNYQNFKNSGTVSISDFYYDSQEMVHPFEMQSAYLQFDSDEIRLIEMKAKTGNSDMEINGILENFYGFLFQKEELKGHFELQSDRLEVADFMTTSKSTPHKETTSEVIDLKIPSFLDCSIKAYASTVKYSTLTLKNLSGNLLIKDQQATLKNLKMDIFEGKILMQGFVNTKGSTPKFNTNLKLNSLDIASSFSNFSFLKAIAPISNALNGKVNADIQLQGLLNQSLTPNLKTLSGDLSAGFINAVLDPQKAPMLKALNQQTDFLNIKNNRLEDTEVKLSFENGKVIVHPFDLNYNDIDISVSGNHQFDQSMNYDLEFDVPLKYFGKEVSGLLATTDAQSTDTFPVKGNLTGSFTSPSLTTDFKGATKSLMNQLVKQQQQGLLDKGKNMLKGLFGKKEK